VEKKLRELINKFLQEYNGHHTMKNASPRPFADDEDEVENYTYKSIYGGDGGHYRNEPAFANPNRTKMGMFELKKFIEDTIKEQAFGHATLTTQGAPRTRAVAPAGKDPYTGRVEYPYTVGAKTKNGMMEQDDDLDRKDLEAARGTAKRNITRIERARKRAITAANQGKGEATKGISQQETELAKTNEKIEELKQEYTRENSLYKQLGKRFQSMPADEEFFEEKSELYEQIVELRGKLQTLWEEIKTTRKSRNEMSKGIQQANSAQTSQPSVTGPFDDQLDDAKDALSDIGKTVAETLLRQYEKERANVNLMEQMDSYNETTRGSLQKFFEMFEAGKTTSEIIRHYAKKGIQIPEQFCSKVKKQFESYKKLKLELGFSEQEAKDFKKALDLSQKEDTKQISTKIFKK